MHKEDVDSFPATGGDRSEFSDTSLTEERQLSTDDRKGVNVPVRFHSKDDELNADKTDVSTDEPDRQVRPEESAGRMQESIDQLLLVSQKLSTEVADLKKDFCEQMKMKTERDEERARFKKAYDDMQKYKAGWEKETLKPWIRCMFDLYDHVRSMSCYYQAKTPAFGAPPNVYGDLLREFELVGEKILSLLDQLDIVRIDPEPGTPFDRRVQNCLETKPCSDPDWNNRVCECTRAGFKYNNGPMFRPADVSIWKFNAEEADTDGCK